MKVKDLIAAAYTLVHPVFTNQTLAPASIIFLDYFTAMAFSQYAMASGDESIKQLAVKTYFNILKKQNNPKGIYEKSTGSRLLKSFALPMILSNLALEFEDVLDKELNQKLKY